VDLVEVDDVDAQPAQARVAGADDPLRLQTLAARVRDGEADLRGEHDLVAPACEPRGERALALAVVVRVGGVHERAAGREERVEDPVGLGRRRGFAHEHRAEREAADRERPEVGVIHG
jgi:hypothetical protein